MLKAIMSIPLWALASRIACRNEPGPVSLVLVTTNCTATPSLVAVLVMPAPLLARTVTK